jgi:hypothetical protein
LKRGGNIAAGAREVVMTKGFWTIGIASGFFIMQLMPGSPAMEQAQAAGVEKMVKATPGVTQVVMDAPGELTIKPGNDEKVVIEAEPKVLAKLEAVVSGDTLTLKTKGNIRTDKGIFYTVTLRKFRSVKTLSSGNVAISGFSGNEIDVLASGSGDIVLSGIKPTRLSLKIVDAGNITASGEGAQFSAKIEGSGNIDAMKFAARRAEASIEGAGNISLRAEESLKATIDGVGNIEYAGKARVSKQINGAGNIERAD